MEFEKKVSHSALDKSENDLSEIATQLAAGVEIKDRTHRLKNYPKCFLGNDAVTWLITNKIVMDVKSALCIGNLLMGEGLFKHVTGDHSFKNESLFYRFSIHEASHGSVSKNHDGTISNWNVFLPAQWVNDEKTDNLQPTKTLKSAASAGKQSKVAYAKEFLEVSPLDKHNVKLLNNVHPASWDDPDVARNYNLVVLGAGAGGLITSSGAAGVGAKVALIESNLMGGDCLNVGCVPSKALIKCAKMAHYAQHMETYGIDIDGKVEVNFPKIMERMRKLRSDISVNDSAERFSSTFGVDVFFGSGKFTSKNTLEVNGKKLTFSKAVIATGGSAAIPPIPGLTDVPFLTNATFFNLETLPPRFGVIGAGPIGCELAQSMARFGSQVSMFLRSNHILGKEEKEAADIVLEKMKQDGVDFLFGIKYESVEIVESQGNKQAIQLNLAQGDKKINVIVDELLLATGRRPNVKGIGLEKAGVQFDTRKGVTVNDYMQTTNKAIYAVGDCCTKYQFTHMADAMARKVIRNALFFMSEKVSNLLIPWATFTDPEIGHVGLYEADLEERNLPFDTYEKEFSDNDRAICDGETEGYVKILCKKGTDQIYGATICGAGAGDMISEITLAMKTKTGLGKIASVIHPYPTHAEIIRGCGDLYNRTRLTSTVKKLFRNLMVAQR